MALRLNLGKYLEHHQISAYRMVQVCKLAPNTIYTLARQPAQRIDLDTISAVLAGLQTITGRAVQIADLIEEVETLPVIENPKLAVLLKSAKPALTLETMRGQKLTSKEREAFERSLREGRESERQTISVRESGLIETMSGRDQ